LDAAQYGGQRVDWLGFLSNVPEGLYTEAVDPKWTMPPPQPAPPPAESVLVGPITARITGR
jgi:hypothetical protein